MRSISFVAMSVIVLSGAGVLAAPNHDLSEPEPEFREWHLNSVPLNGFYVYRDSTSWNDEFLSGWLFGPKPRPDFSDSLMVVLGYGWSACSHTGGGMVAITRKGDTATISLDHIYELDPQCLAEMPRNLYFRVAKSTIPDDVHVVFEEAAPGYPLDPQRWYPLAVGNAWHYREWQAGYGYTDRVEVVTGTVEHDDRTWHHLRTIYCSPDPCAGSVARFLNWTDDHYLLETETPPDAPGAVPDTLHATSPRSLFTVNLPRDNTLTSPEGPVYTSILMNNWNEWFYPVLWASTIGEWREDFARYLYGFGPWTGDLAAIIDGERFGDTSTILMALDVGGSPRTADQVAIDVYPHPAGRSSVIAFTPGQSGVASVTIFDLRGRLVFEMDASVAAGIPWQMPLGSAGRLASGVYVVRILEPDGRSATRSMIVID